MDQARKPRGWIGMAAGALLLLLSGLLLFGPTGRDDVYKTLWPAKVFGETGRMLNYNGDALEQSSSLLHVLALGGLHWLTGFDLPDLNLVFILVIGVACIGMTVRLGRRLGIRNLVFLGILMGLQAVFAYWVMGGLDAVLAGLCWLAFVVAATAFVEGGRPWGMGMATVLVVLVRPEGAWIAAAGLVMAGTWRFLGNRKAFIGKQESDAHDRLQFDSNNSLQPSRRQEGIRWAAMLGMVILVASALACWRIWHSGHWQPQPVIAKSGGFGMVKALDGLRYVWRETLVHPELWVLWLGVGFGLVAWVRKRDLPIGLQFALSISCAGLAFVVVSGGDWMENGRFLVPFLPLLVLISCSRLEALPKPWRRVGMVGWLAVSLAGLVIVARGHSTGYSLLQDAGGDWVEAAQSSSQSVHGEFGDHSLAFSERHNRVHLRDIAPLAALKAATAEAYAQKRMPVTILSQQAGMMAYYLADEFYGKFRFIDLVGLCTADFTDCSVTTHRGNFRGGLNMDLIYFLEDLPKIGAACGIEAPDIVFGLDDAEGALRRQLMKHGYRLVFEQDGIMPMGEGWFSGMEIEAGEFVAVKE